MMERAAVARSPFGFVASNRFLPAATGSSTAPAPHFPVRPKLLALVSTSRRRIFGSAGRKCVAVRASASSSHSKSDGSIAPLQLESPVGQFLSQILVSHPHLVPAAVDQQLEQLQTDREAEKQQDEASASGTDLVLYRRIAEVKANERKKALEEILYALVVQRFMDAEVSLVPSIARSSSDPSGRVDTWPNEEMKFEKVHSSDAYEMVRIHLAMILRNRMGDTSSVVNISKLRVGQVYAASVLYGYFLKRVDQRFQLEKTMKVLPSSLDEEGRIPRSMGQEKKSIGEDTFQTVSSHAEVPEAWSAGVNPGGSEFGMKTSRLGNYVMSLGSETIHKYATIRSKESVTIIEKHTEALFGQPEIVITPEGTIDSSKDELITISFGGLKRLVLEAVTFGSFLCDVESYVDARYHFSLN